MNAAGYVGLFLVVVMWFGARWAEVESWIAAPRLVEADATLDEVLSAADGVLASVQWSEEMHFAQWDAEYDDWVDGLTAVADEVWPDGDNRAGGSL